MIFGTLVLAQALVAPKAPAPATVKIGAPLNCRIRQVPPPKEQKFSDPKSRDLIFRIGDKQVHIKPPEEFAVVEDSTLVGKDGSVRVDYYVAIDPGAYTGTKIITNHPQRRLLAKAFDPTGPYQDAKNYVRSYYKDVNAIDMPNAPGTVVQRINGVEHELGGGMAIKTWWPNRVLASISVDTNNVPSGYEFTDHGFLRMYDKGKAIEIGPYDFLGLVDDRTLAVMKDDAVYMWRDGSFISARRVPKDWEFVKVNVQGDVLVRHRVASDASDDLREKIWDMGILHGNTIFPLKFKKPASSNGLLWRDTQGFDSSGRVRFSGFYGDVEKFYEVTPLRT